MKFTNYEKIRYEFFEVLLPELLCNGSDREKEEYLHYMIYNGSDFIPDMVEMLCSDDGVICPHKKTDYQINKFERGGVFFIQILLPRIKSEVNNILRAYLLYSEISGTIKEYKYFIIKEFAETKDIYIVNVFSKENGLLGDNLANHKNDFEYEYWKLAQCYCDLILSSQTNK